MCEFRAGDIVECVDAIGTTLNKGSYYKVVRTDQSTGSQDEDERKKLDRVSQSLKLLAKELRICIVMISHTNDDGKTRGSRNISQVANTLIPLERNKVATDASERLRTYLTIEKARLGGTHHQEKRIHM